MLEARALCMQRAFSATNDTGQAAMLKEVQVMKGADVPDKVHGRVCGVCD